MSMVSGEQPLHMPVLQSHSMTLDELNEKAISALSGTSQEERTMAAESLRFLSCYDAFPFLKAAIQGFQNHQLHGLFLACKSMKFVVCNELGPTERDVMQDMALTVMAKRLASVPSIGQPNPCPLFIIRSLFGIFAAGLYLNWRTMIINNNWSADPISCVRECIGRDTDPALKYHLGEYTLHRLFSRIGDERYDIIVEGKCEIVQHFLREIPKNGNPQLKNAFTLEMLPSFFETAIDKLRLMVQPNGELRLELPMEEKRKETLQRILDVCTLCFEGVLAHSQVKPLIEFANRDGNSLYLQSAHKWIGPMKILAGFCREVVSISININTKHINDQKQIESCLELLGLMSSAVFSDCKCVGDGNNLCEIYSNEVDGDFSTPDGFLHELLQVAVCIIFSLKYKEQQQHSTSSHHLIISSQDQLNILYSALSILINVFERNDLFVGPYVYSNLELLNFLSEILDSLGHMVSNRQIWASLESIDKGDLVLDARARILHLFYLIGEKGVPSNVEGLPGSVVSIPGPQVEFRVAVVGIIHAATVSYFNGIMEGAYLMEDNYDIKKEGFILNLNRQLDPLTEMLFSEVVDFMTIVERFLEKTLRLHLLCTQLKGVTSPESIPPGTSEEDFRELDYLCVEFCGRDSLFSLTSNQTRGAASREPQGPMLVLNVLLSRISILVELTGQAVKTRYNRVMRSRGYVHNAETTVDSSLVNHVVRFASNFISADHKLTDMLLQCMTLMDVPCGTSGGSAGAETTEKLHLGVLRALFSFCSNVHETHMCRNEGVMEMMAELVSYALVDHGDCFPLAFDANTMLRKILQERSALSAMPQTQHLIDQYKQNNIMLVSPSFTSTDETARDLRQKTLISLVELSEYRADGILSDFTKATETLIDEDFYLFLDDVIGLCEGIVYACSHSQVMTMLAVNRHKIIEAMKKMKTAAEGSVNKLRELTERVAACWRKVAANCSFLLSMDLVNSRNWEVSGLFFDSLQYLIEVLSCTSFNGERSFFGDDDFSIISDSLPEGFVFDTCSILTNTLLGKWCNVGVMMYYGDNTVQSVFMYMLEHCSGMPVEILLSDDKRSGNVFSAIYAALTVGANCHVLRDGLASFSVWPDVVDTLTSCLEYMFIPMVVRCLGQLLPLETLKLDGGVCASLCRICLITLATTTVTEVDALELVDIAKCCYSRATSKCEAEIEYLLDIASAFHRVRIRSLLNSFRSPPPQGVALSYIQVFGTTSEVATIAPW